MSSLPGLFRTSVVLVAIAALGGCSSDNTTSTTEPTVPAATHDPGWTPANPTTPTSPTNPTNPTNPTTPGGDDAGTQETDAGTDAGSSAVTFSDVYTNIIAKHCTGCHGATHSTGLAMGTKQLAYDNLVGTTSGVLANGTACKNGTRKRVTPGASATSLVWNKVNGTQDCGSQMPLGGTKLAQSEIDAIAAWIDGGAKND